MSKLRVESFTISLDGFGASPDQDLNNPMGVGGHSLHGWAMSTPTFQRNVFGREGGEAGLDEDYAARGFQNIGAWILGRNMFGPVRGRWPDESWRGWWGDNPVYHMPVFVLTHHARAPLVMAAAPPSTSSPKASTPRWCRRVRRPAARMCVWAAA